MTNELNALHYLFTTESERLVAAHCLDLDIATSARTLAEAEESLDALVQFHLMRACEWRKAPRQCWNALSRADQMQPRTLEIDIPPRELTVNRGHENIPVLRAQLPMVA